MCGICGFVSKNSNNEEQINKNIFNMLSVLNHRGPDNSDHWVSDDKKIILGHTRLSIMDLSSNGNQPMLSKNNKMVISYNGETYNHINLRKILVNENYKGNSDTETILSYFEKYGFKKTLKEIDGMFSMALFDKRERNLYLARDRFGEKPLYYSISDKTIIFGSEIKTILKHETFKKEINTTVLHDYFNFNYIGGKNSIYKNIKKVLPSHYLKINIDTFKFEEICYWEKNKKNKSNSKISLDQAIIKVEKNLIESINNRLTSDLPVGCFLSGGVDSSLVTSIVKKHFDNELNTFSIGFDNAQYDESRYAKKIANYLNTKHHEYFLKDDEIFEVSNNISKIYDEPFADSSQIPTLFLSKLTKKKITVCLTGDGADELFFGYDRYTYAPKIYNYLKFVPKKIRDFVFKNKDSSLNFLKHFLFLFLKIRNIKNPQNKVNKILNLINYEKFSDIYKYSISNELNSENILNKNIKNNFSLFDVFKDVKDTQLSEMINFDINEYLPNDILTKVDRASMSYSLETRTPFLNHNLAELAFSLPYSLHNKENENKYILKKILSKYLPQNLFQRPKMGFGVPLNNWLKNQLIDMCEDLLSYKKLEESGYLNSEYIRENYEMFKQGRLNIHSSIWSILMFQSWYFNNFK